MITFPRKNQHRGIVVLDKCSSQRSRAGNVVERIGKMVANGVSSDVIAMQLTKNSPTDTHYTSEAVEVLYNVWKDCSGSLVTAKQTTALIEDVRNNSWNSELVPGVLM